MRTDRNLSFIFQPSEHAGSVSFLGGKQRRKSQKFGHIVVDLPLFIILGPALPKVLDPDPILTLWSIFFY
jgi:hypothetical protein